MAEDEKESGDKGGGTITKILSGAAIALLAGGTVPWWYGELTHHKATDAPTPQPQVQQTVLPSTQSVGLPAPVQPAGNSPAAGPVAGEAQPLASRDFFVGTWRVDQNISGVSGSNKTTYFEDGHIEGQQTMVQGFMGRVVPLTGTWEVTVLSRMTFLLSMQTNAGPFRGHYRILDQNHVQNTDDNYVAERVD